MTRPIIRIHNSETDEIIDREMNDEEYEQHLVHIEQYKIEEGKRQAQAAAKAALLERLGITEEEAKLLLG